MDVTITNPCHLRVFCAALISSSKVAKDVYLEFDSTKGLTVRCLNDAKSAYVCFHFGPHFFRRCTTTTNHHNEANMRHSNKKKKKRRRRQSDTQSPDDSTTTASPSQQPSSDSKFLCRIPLRSLAPVVRPRKHEVSLRIQSEWTQSGDQKNDDNDNESGGGNNGTLCLTFEWTWEAYAQQDNHSNDPVLLKAVHRVPVAQMEHVSAAVAPRLASSSELQAAPSTLLRLLEPLKRTAEAALLVKPDATHIYASSFHANSSAAADSGVGGFNTAYSDSLLKTETGLSTDELDEFYFVSDRAVNEDENQNQNNTTTPTPPPDVNRHVVLVFPMKEAKAFLQFGSSAVQASGGSGHSHYHRNDNHQDDNVEPAPAPRVHVYFQWGGQPLVWHIVPGQGAAGGYGVAAASCWKAELILATLDHGLVGVNPWDDNNNNAGAAAAGQSTSTSRRSSASRNSSASTNRRSSSTSNGGRRRSNVSHETSSRE